MAIPKSADLVIVRAGTVGGWASWFAATSGAKDVVVLDQGRAGEGASSRAAGVVRAQGRTPETVGLGQWSVDFYNRQRELLNTDSGFRELGYLILAITKKRTSGLTYRRGPCAAGGYGRHQCGELRSRSFRRARELAVRRPRRAAVPRTGRGGR